MNIIATNPSLASARQLLVVLSHRCVCRVRACARVCRAGAEDVHCDRVVSFFSHLFSKLCYFFLFSSYRRTLVNFFFGLVWLWALYASGGLASGARLPYKNRCRPYRAVQTTEDVFLTIWLHSRRAPSPPRSEWEREREWDEEHWVHFAWGERGAPRGWWPGEVGRGQRREPRQPGRGATSCEQIKASETMWRISPVYLSLYLSISCSLSLALQRIKIENG